MRELHDDHYPYTHCRLVTQACNGIVQSRQLESIIMSKHQRTMHMLCHNLLHVSVNLWLDQYHLLPIYITRNHRG